MKSLAHLSRPAVGLLLASVLASCASEKAIADAKKEKENSKDYVEYYPTGSNIPVRVRKDQLKTSDKRTETDQQALAEIQTLGQRAEKGPPGGAK